MVCPSIKLGVSDRIGSKMVVLGCDISVKDHRHFYDIACAFKHEQVQVKLTRTQSKNLQADKTDRKQQKSHDGSSLTPHSRLFNNTSELTVETNHPSSAISCASTFKLPSSTSSNFISSESTTSSESSAALSHSQTSSTSDNTALNGDITSSVDMSLTLQVVMVLLPQTLCLTVQPSQCLISL